MVRRRTPWAISSSGQRISPIASSRAGRGEVEPRSCRPAAPSVAGQIVERELGAGHDELPRGRSWQSGTRVVGAGEQATVLDQVQAIERREATAVQFPSKRRRRAPEDRQPLVEHRALALLRVRDQLDRGIVRRWRWVAEDQAEVDVADELAETAVCEAPQRVGGEQPVAERDPIGLHRLGQDPLAVAPTPHLAHSHARGQSASGPARTLDRGSVLDDPDRPHGRSGGRHEAERERVEVEPPVDHVLEVVEVLVVRDPRLRAGAVRRVLVGQVDEVGEIVSTPKILTPFSFIQCTHSASTPEKPSRKAGVPAVRL